MNEIEGGRWHSRKVLVVLYHTHEHVHYWLVSIMIKLLLKDPEDSALLDHQPQTAAASSGLDLAIS